MDTYNLCKTVGDFFGHFFEEAGQLCIDNGDTIYRYGTPEALLIDWADTLLEQHFSSGGNWGNELTHIYNNVSRRPFPGVRRIAGKKGDRWQAYADINDGTRHGKNYHLGTWSTLTAAAAARAEFLEAVARGADPAEQAATQRRKR